MSFFKPNLITGDEWRTTLISAFTQLRKPSFATEDTFVLSNYDPSPNWYGMTVSGILIQRSLYLKLNKLIFLSFDISATLAAPLALSFSVTLPGARIAAGNLGYSQVISVSNNGVAGFGSIDAGNTEIFFSVPGAGARRIIGNGFIEVS